ncbi:O-antigen ligase family protein [Clostridium perfringens]|nr:O-antigen ligase family protein [Clostridium perfringens]
MLENKLQDSSSQQKNKKIKYIYFIFGLFLNHTNIIFGLNSSFSDIIMIMIMIHIIGIGLELPYKATMFFCTLSILLIFVPTFFVPYYLDVYIEGRNILINYFKYLVSFGYFILGYNIMKRNFQGYVLKGFLTSSIIVATLGIIAVITNNYYIKSTLFLSGVRLQGIMNDPNYFVVHQICSFIIVIINVRKKSVRNIMLLILGLSIFLSGSKTGLISWIMVMLIFINFKLISTKINYKKISKIIIIFIIIIVFILISKNVLSNIINNLSVNVPSVGRVLKLFTNFSEAITGDGSSRTDTWQTALNMMGLSPIFGIGAGSYLTIANRIFNSGVLAHNTYLQLLCEWGIPFTILFFLWVFYNCQCAIRNKNNQLYGNIANTCGYIILTFLLGSLSISLNNARFFWLVLGFIIALRKMFYLKVK